MEVAGGDAGRGSALGASGPALTRREVLQKAARLGVAASTLGALELLASTPRRAGAATLSTLP
ncbi:MAG TPA: hypothetical protein VKG62_04290, partial [Solirubrobacteraceae bacterium]|nr:hypothetical protein [Solirubrobacteraceae bacterium]